MDELERLARLICQATYAHVPPDARVARGAPYWVAGGNAFIAPPAIETIPLWTLYIPAAEKIREDEARRTEERRARYAKAFEPLPD